MASKLRAAAFVTAASCALAGSGLLLGGPLISEAATADSRTYRITSSAIHLTQPTDPEIGSSKPSATAASTGMYGSQIQWPIVPIHAALSRRGTLISYGTPYGSGTDQGGFVFDSWNPAAGVEAAAHSDTNSMGYDSFCNSLITLPDGRVLMVGGNSSMSTMLYDPITGSTVAGADLNKQRWYATTLRLPSGKILVLGGTDTYNRHTVQNLPPGQTTGTTPEIGDGTGRWTSLTGATSVAAFGAKHARWFYPRAFNAPGGKVYGFSGPQLWELDPTGSGKLRLTGKLPFDPGPSTSQVMFAPGKVLIASGGSHSPNDHIVATKRAIIVDFNGAKPKVMNTGSLRYARNWLNLTVLPNGKVLANGGTSLGTAGGEGNSVKVAEIWNPATGRWSTVAGAQRTRTYHSTSLLLPSGAVFTGGSGAAPFTDGATSGPENNMNAELYYPANLFAKGKDGAVVWAKRPRIDTIAGSATYGGKLKLKVGGAAAKISDASLITLPTVTHSLSTDQRRVALKIRQRGSKVELTLPKSKDLLPPGDYELTVTNASGVPSPAQIITIKRTGSGYVTLAIQRSSRMPASAAEMDGTKMGHAHEAEVSPAPAAEPSASATPAATLPAETAPSQEAASPTETPAPTIDDGETASATAAAPN